MHVNQGNLSSKRIAAIFHQREDSHLYFVFEARTGHQAYAITRSMAASQPDNEQDDDVGIGTRANQKRGFWEPNPGITNDFSHASPFPQKTSPSSLIPNGVRIGKTVNDAILWHNRLVHRAISTLQNAGIISKVDPPYLCKACVEGKQTKLPYRLYEHNAKRILWRVHSDMSRMSIPAVEKGYIYFITFIDDLSRYA
jgi:hypothetical protein